MACRSSTRRSLVFVPTAPDQFFDREPDCAVLRIRTSGRSHRSATILPLGKYVVEVVVPLGHELVKEDDKKHPDRGRLHRPGDGRSLVHRTGDTTC